MLKPIIIIVLTTFFVWGVWNESKLASLERKLFAKIKALVIKK